jgi:hypothetical protein
MTADPYTPVERIRAIIEGYWHSRAMVVAAELELADLLAAGPLSIDALAARTKTDPGALFRLLRALESIGLFTQVSPYVFANTPASECLRQDDPLSQRAWTRLTLSKGMGQYEGWAGLLDSIRTGRGAYVPLFGHPFWQFLEENPEKSAIFNEAMRSLASPMTPAVTAAYDWGRFPVIADVGGGLGSQLVSILDAHPGSRGILFDQPAVIAAAIPHDRMERVGGDFLHSVPAGADAYILRWIIHDWAEPEALAILANVRKAMKPGSVVAVIEWVIPETPEPTLGKWMDLHMHVLLGGRERTTAEYADLIARAGLTMERVIPTASSLSIVIARI